MATHWPYYTLACGKLYICTRRGMFEAFHNSNPPRFDSVAAAESWLVEQDIRGNVREAAR